MDVSMVLTAHSTETGGIRITTTDALTEDAPPATWDEDVLREIEAL